MLASNIHVLPFRRDDRAVRPCPGITAELGEILRSDDDEAFLSRFQIAPTAAERSMTPDEAQEAPPDAPAAMASLRRTHKKQPFYVIETIQSVPRCGIGAGEVLVVAPSAPLHCLGLAIVAPDGHQPDLRFFVGKRGGHGIKAWIFATENPGISIEDESTLSAVHPIIGHLEAAMRYDDERAWTSRIAGLLKTSSCCSAALNRRWRP